MLVENFVAQKRTEIKTKNTVTVKVYEESAKPWVGIYTDENYKAADAATQVCLLDTT